MCVKRRILCLLLAVLFVVSVGLSACSSKEPAATTPATTTAGTTQKAAETKAPTQKEKDTGKGKTLDISWFEGGTGRIYVDRAIESYQAMYPDLVIIADIHPKNHETLRPRFVAGNPPDVVMANGSFFDYFALIADGQLEPLNDMLDSPSPDDEKVKLRDMFVEGVLGRGVKDGVNYVVPGFVYYYGLWYDENNFNKNGWKVPTNYDEWIEVSEQIKQSGKMAPFVYQGQYAYYLQRGILFPSICQYGGIEVFKEINNLEPGAWKKEAVLNAVRDVKNYCDKYLMEGTLALNHTQAQMEFINHRAAMIPCGTFLDNEMKGNWPDDFVLKYTFPPVNKPGSDKTYIVATSDFRAVPRDAKNPEMAKEFLMMMYNKANRRVAGEVAGAVYPIKEGAKGLDDVLPASVVYTHNKVDQGNVQALFVELGSWYKPLQNELLNAITSLVDGTCTVEQFAENVEAAAEAVRNDASIIKYRME